MLKHFQSLLFAGCLFIIQQAEAQKLVVEKQWLANKEVRAIHFSSEYGLIAGTGDGIILYASAPILPQHAYANAFPVSTFFEDSNKDLWIGGLGYLRKVTSTRSITYSINDDIGLNGRVIFSISEDLDKKIWASAPGGAAVYSNEVWKTYTTADGLKHGVVHDVCQADNRAMWFATRKGGLNILNSGDWKYELSENNTRKLFKSTDGQIWVGTSEGLFSQQGDRWILHSGSTTVLPIFQDENSNIWCISGGTSITVVSPNGDITSYDPLGDEVTEIYDMCLDNDGGVWLATNAGVFGCKRV